MYTKECLSCTTTFEFSHDNILNRGGEIKKKTIKNRRPIIKRGVFSNSYSGEETVEIETYKIHEKYIVCPICEYVIILKKDVGETPTNRETVINNVSEWDMFGPNGPRDIGEDRAIDYWQSKIS